MKTLYWLLMLVLVGLLGYLLHAFIEGRKYQVEFLNYEVSLDSIAVFEARVDSLKETADSLRDRLDRAGLLSRGSVRAHLALVEDELITFKRTVEMWRKARPSKGGRDLYRQAVLLYGRASAASQALAYDTLLGSVSD
ncbi:MAG: hypothetical protein R6X12_05375 [bacterium]